MTQDEHQPLAHRPDTHQYTASIPLQSQKQGGYSGHSFQALYAQFQQKEPYENHCHRNNAERLPMSDVNPKGYLAHRCIVKATLIHTRF